MADEIWNRQERLKCPLFPLPQKPSILNLPKKKYVESHRSKILNSILFKAVSDLLTTAQVTLMHSFITITSLYIPTQHSWICIALFELTCCLEPDWVNSGFMGLIQIFAGKSHGYRNLDETLASAMRVWECVCVCVYMRYWGHVYIISQWLYNWHCILPTICQYGPILFRLSCSFIYFIIYVFSKLNVFLLSAEQRTPEPRPRNNQGKYIYISHVIMHMSV